PGSSSGHLTWTGSTDDVGVVAYDVYWFDGWFGSRRVATSETTSAGVTLGGVSPTGTPRDEFYVRARDAAGNVSIASNTVIFTGGVSPSSAPPSSVPPSSPPPAPSCSITYRTSSTWPG